MTADAIRSCGRARRHRTSPTTEPEHRLRLLIVMSQGSPGALAEAWRSYAHVEDARASAAAALRHPQVLHVGIVDDGWGHVGSANPLSLVEWVGGVIERRPRWQREATTVTSEHGCRS